jgi:hypothetical protein
MIRHREPLRAVVIPAKQACEFVKSLLGAFTPERNEQLSGFEIETVRNIRAGQAGLWLQQIPNHEHAPA